MEYVLSAELVGHERDVRGVCALKSGGLVSTSRDNSVKLWVREEIVESTENNNNNNNGVVGGVWRCKFTYTGHTHFVGPVVELMDGTFATGGYDGVIIVWSLAHAEQAELTLLGHEQAVVALAVTAAGDVVSGSWDKTVRVWHKGEVAQILRGHTEGVWGVCCAPNGDIWSGSADKTIRIWRGGNCVRTISDSQDVVRQLRAVPGVGVVSASNDGIVRVYSWEGHLLRQLHGHSSFVYTCAPLAEGEVISGGEDCSVRVWSPADECIQTLQFPGTVWDVDVFPSNGDIAVGCADFVTRIFTRDPARAASEVVRAAFDARILAALEAAKQPGKVGDLELDKMPGVEALQQPGTHEGQHKVIRKAQGNGAEAWIWQGGKWELIGDVTNAVNKPGQQQQQQPARRGNKELNFDVDFNGRKLVISMNRTDNIYETAKQFIADNDLSEEMIDQVVEHLHKVVPPQSGPHRNPDPFTGGADDGSASFGGSAVTRGANVEELSYNPSPWAEDAVPAKKAKPAAAAAAPSGPARVFPRSTYILFDVPGNLAGLSKKTQEWGANGPQLQVLVQKLGNPKAVFALADLQVVSTILAWEDKAHRFPALDLLRLVALSESGSQLAARDGLWKQAVTAGLGVAAPMPMLTFRMLCNCFRWPALKSSMLAELPWVLDLMAEQTQVPDEKVLNAMVSLLQNVAVHLATAGTGHSDVKMQAIGVLGEILGRPVIGAPDLTLAIASLGTLIWKDSEARSLIADLEIASKLDHIVRTQTDATAKNAAQQLLTYSSKMDTAE